MTELLDIMKDLRRSAKGFAAALDRAVGHLEKESEDLLALAEGWEREVPKDLDLAHDREIPKDLDIAHNMKG